MTTFCDYLYAATDNTKHGLDEAKRNALECYKVAARAILDAPGDKLPSKDSILWQNFIEAKKICMCLGVGI